jgi:hypothetical protein
MAPISEPESADTTELRELDASAQRLRTLCEQVSRLIDGARSDDRLAAREARFQIAAFEERRQRALSLLDTRSREPYSIRLGNLEKIAEAVECSRAYFSAFAGAEPACEPASSWPVRVR